jgi:hypothetical protein
LNYGREIVVVIDEVDTVGRCARENMSASERAAGAARNGKVVVRRWHNVKNLATSSKIS